MAGIGAGSGLGTGRVLPELALLSWSMDPRIREDDEFEATGLWSVDPRVCEDDELKATGIWSVQPRVREDDELRPLAYGPWILASARMTN